MREFDGNSLTKRLEESRRATQARLKKVTEASKIDDPVAAERKAAERAIIQARRVEVAARREAKAEAARVLAAHTHEHGRG